jgi:hypothetical protein
MAVRHEGFFLLTYPFYRIMLILEQRRRAMAVVMMKEVGSHISLTTTSYVFGRMLCFCFGCAVVVSIWNYIMIELIVATK